MTQTKEYISPDALLALLRPVIVREGNNLATQGSMELDRMVCGVDVAADTLIAANSQLFGPGNQTAHNLQVVAGGALVVAAKATWVAMMAWRAAEALEAAQPPTSEAVH